MSNRIFKNVLLIPALTVTLLGCTALPVQDPAKNPSVLANHEAPWARGAESCQAAIADYDANAKPDAWREYDAFQQFASALVRAGDPDSAFIYIDRIVKSYGPWVYRPLSINVALDPVRDDPRYLKLKSDYETWAAETGQ